MKHRPAILLSGLALLLGAASASAQSVERTGVAAMVGAINAERARHSLPPLTEDPRLDAIAEAHSMEMARARYFSHVSPSTGQPWDRVSQAGLHYRAVAENIAINQSPEAAQQALLRSPGHHENMVSTAQRSVGVGIVRHGDQVWVTQLFATLTDAAPAVTRPPAPSAAEPDDADTDCDAPSAPATPRVPALNELLTGLGLTRPSAQRAGRAAPRTITLQTPFGPMRVEVPAALATPSAPRVQVERGEF